MNMEIAQLQLFPTLFDLVVKSNYKGHDLNQGDIIIFASVGAGMNINAITYQI